MATTLAPVAQAVVLASGAAPQISALRKSVPSFSGLRSVTLSSRAAGASTPAPAKRRYAVVCEATETTTVGSVTDATFKSLVLDSDVPVLVDFWAPWCGPCRMIEPLINEIAGQYGSKLKVFKLNTDESPGIATEYGIRSIPTVMVFKRGKKVDTVIGAVPKSTLTSTIDKYL